jgi:hypothetical protein
MSQLTIAVQPGFSDLADSAIAGGQPLTDSNIQAISHNAKFGVVRCEFIYMGFFTSGNTVGTPTSPVDGYTYSRAECQYIAVVYSSRKPAAGFTPGQAAPPALANSVDGSGALLDCPYVLDINDSIGVLTSETNWASSGVVAGMTIKVYCLAQRLSVNVSD